MNTDDKYGSINIILYRYLKLININTVKDRPNEFQFNGKSKQMSVEILKHNFYKIFDKICFYKLIQLSDYGLKNQSNVYAALVQNCFSTGIYKFLQANGNYSKLRNYIVLNNEHSTIRYYAKIVTILNLYVLAKIFFIILMENFYVPKNKKKQR